MTDGLNAVSPSNAVLIICVVDTDASGRSVRDLIRQCG